MARLTWSANKVNNIIVEVVAQKYSYDHYDQACCVEGTWNGLLTGFAAAAAGANAAFMN